MVNRTHFQCSSCGHGIICRTQFGAGREQTYLFPCPKCKVDIGFTLFIDQEKLGWKYSDLVNLSHCTGSVAPTKTLNFASDFLVSKEHVDSPTSFTPQLQNIELVKDMGEYFMLSNTLRAVAEQFWPILKRANTHRENSNREHFDKELKKIKADEHFESYDETSMATILVDAYEKFGGMFTHSSKHHRKLIRDRVNEATRINPSQVQELKDFYQNEGRAEGLFHQLRSIEQQWVDLYSFFAPLEILDCLKDPNQELSAEYTLSEKPIERLKAFYTNCYETTGRILVLAGSYEGIISGDGVGIPSRRRLVPPEDFEKAANGSKPDLISGMPFWPVLEDVYDSKLRNGIGHHSWQYDAVTDTIHYQNHSPSRGKEEFSMPYLDFCIHVRGMFHALNCLSVYVHSVWDTPSNED